MPVQTRFRIRGDFHHSRAEEKRREAAYDRFLARLAVPAGDELRRYFGWDFFHDGPIEDLRVAADAREVSFRIQATWIRPKVEADYRQRGSLGAWFRCVFYDVVWLSLGAERINRTNDPLTERLQLEYNRAEIDSLRPELAALDRQFRAYLREIEGRFRSLLIRLTPPSGMLGLIFTRLVVDPKEPLTWEALVLGGQYQLDLYELPVRRRARRK